MDFGISEIQTRIGSLRERVREVLERVTSSAEQTVYLMAQTLTFSVVIPTWNRVAPLERAIRSLLEQNYPDWEAIIVEDGSPNQNEVVSMIRGLGDSRISVELLSNNHNGAFARNVGIRAAAGDWIAFLDSDDWFQPDKLSRVAETIRRTKLSSGTVIYHQAISKSINGSQITPCRGKHHAEQLADYLFVEHCFFNTSAFVVDRETAMALLFDETCIKHQDYDFLLRAEQHGVDFFFIEEPLGVREFRTAGENVGKRFLPDFSINWYLSRAALFSRAAGAAFLYMHVLDPMVDHGRVATIKTIPGLLRASGAVRNRVLMHVLSTLLPYSWYAFVRKRSLQLHEE